MPKRYRSHLHQTEGENHPIAWFSALLRGVDRNDKTLVDEAQDQLEQLGYFVVPFHPSDPSKKGVA
ncbi:MAG: hypothetical protein ACHRXM_15370 [Isosphaerales bacterium]